MPNAEAATGLDFLREGVLESLVEQGRIPSYSPGMRGVSEYYWVVIPPRAIQPGDVARQIDGNWRLESPNGTSQPYSYTPVTFGEKEIISRKVLTLLVEQDLQPAKV